MVSISMGVHMMFAKEYEIIPNPPAPITWDEYAKESYAEYQLLLETESHNERIFQAFFEENPSFIPGAFELLGPSGHYPFSQSLISEPEIYGAPFRRFPDFIWLAQDSLYFTPVFIEIERPSKKTFTDAGVQTADFSQALGQIVEWKAILSEPENVLNFYKCFNIPDWIREKTFQPQFALIYGRRSEFEGQPFLQRKRAQLVQEGVSLISFDRLHPDPKCDDMLCTKLSQREYKVKTIPPTYRYSPGTADNLIIVSGFQEAISKMKRTTPERMKFLLDRFTYWRDYASKEHKGIIYPSDCE